MLFKNKSIGFALLGALLALSSCRDLDLPPVFYTLSQEQPLGDDKGFPDGSSVFKMVKMAIITPPGDYYLAAAARLYIRGTGLSDTWTIVEPPAGLANATCNTLEVFDDGGGDEVYAGFFNYSSGNGYGLYKASLAVLPLAWTEVTTEPNDVEITLLKVVGGQLFTGTNTNLDNMNALYYGDGSTFTAVTWASPLAQGASIIDVARATSGGSYWVLAGSNLYRSAALGSDFSKYVNTLDSDAPGSPLSGPPISGGLFDDGVALYVSAGNGFLYRTDDGGGLTATSWTRNANAIEDDDKNPVRFTSFAAPGSDAGAVYVGTQGQGYYRIPNGLVDGTLTHEPLYSITSLYYGAINSFFYDNIPSSRLFLCTNSSGLWRGSDFSGSAWTWRQE